MATTHGGRHTFAPFAMEAEGIIRAHGQTTLGMLAEHTVAKGRLPPRARHSTPSSPGSRSPCGFAGGNYASPPGCISPCPAKFCGTLLLLLLRERAISRLLVRQYPYSANDSLVYAHVIRSKHHTNGRGLRPAQISWSDVIPLLFDVQ